MWEQIELTDVDDDDEEERKRCGTLLWTLWHRRNYFDATFLQSTETIEFAWIKVLLWGFSGRTFEYHYFLSLHLSRLCCLCYTRAHANQATKKPCDFSFIDNKCASIINKMQSSKCLTYIYIQHIIIKLNRSRLSGAFYFI